MNELISIIIPVYNVVAFLDECMDSVLKQTYSNIEIIIIDDGSNDGSSEKCDLYGKADARVVVIHQSNKGVSVARNEGVKRARGKYILFVDSDDLIHPKAVEILYSTLVKEKAEIVIGTHKTIEEKEVPNFVDINNIDEYEILTGRECIKRFYSPAYAIDMVIVVNKLYKKEILLKNPYTPNTRYEDEGIAHKIFIPLRKCVYIAENLYFYRQHENSFIHQKNCMRLLDKVEVLKERKQFFEEKKDNELYLLALRRYETAIAETIIDFNSSCPEQYEILDNLEKEFIRCWKEEIKQSRMPVKDKMKYIIFMIDKRVYNFLKKRF